MKVVTLALSVLALAGCASGGRCVGEFEYQRAVNLPTPQPVDGLKPLDTSSALKIPAEPQQKTGYAEKIKDSEGKEKVSCLDVPPAMEVPPAPPAAPSKPEAPAAPEAKAEARPDSKPAAESEAKGADKP